MNEELKIIIKAVNDSAKKAIKDAVKQVLGDKGVKVIKTALGK